MLWGVRGVGAAFLVAGLTGLGKMTDDVYLITPERVWWTVATLWLGAVILWLMWDESL